MGNDSGRGSRSDKPPLATVRRLCLEDDTSGSGATADDWYETERLTGQITGRARSSAGSDKPAVAPEATVALDWRNPAPAADAGAAQRLRRSLGRRRRPRPKVTLRVPRPHNSLRQRRRAAAAEGPTNEPAESSRSTALGTSSDRGVAALPRLWLRHGTDSVLPKAGRALGARIRERVPRLAWGSRASIAAGTLVAAVTAAIGIAVALGGSPAKPRRAAVAGASSGQALGVVSAARALTPAVGLVEHQVGARTNTRRGVRGRRTHRAAHLSHRAHRRPLKSQSAARPPSPSPTFASNSSGSSSSSPVYSGSSSASSTSSQPVTSAASTASTQRTQSTQPAFGQNGTLGPGRGAPSTQ